MGWRKILKVKRKGRRRRVGVVVEAGRRKRRRRQRNLPDDDLYFNLSLRSTRRSTQLDRSDRSRSRLVDRELVDQFPERSLREGDERF